MILSLRDIKFFLIFFLVLMLADSSFAAFIPKAFKGEFTQIKKSMHSLKKVPVKIQYSYPKNIRMVVEDPNNAITYVCNAKKTWIYTPPFMPGEKGHVRQGDSSKYCYSKIFDSLRFGLKSNRFYQVKKINDKVFQLKFNKTAASEVGFYFITIHFDGKENTFNHIDKFVMSDQHQKNTVILQKKSLSLLSKLNPSLFTFNIPANTELELMK